MTEVKDCLPQDARKHFINLRNVRQEAATEKYQERLREIRGQMAVRGLARSGMQQAEEWKVKEEHLESLATEYVQAALETCKLYDIPLTQSICNCFVKAAGEFIDIQFGHLLRSQAQGVADVKVPLSVRQQGNFYGIKIMNRIKVAVETARVSDEKERSAMAKEKEKHGHTYNQSIMQYGGVMNASQAGNVSAQQVTVTALDDLRPALAQMRAFFKRQEESADADEYVGLLASAEKAAAEKDEGKMLGYLKQIPAHAWEIGKAVLPQVLLHYLKARGLA